VGRRVKGAAVSDGRKPNRNEQRRARALAASQGISYMQALSMIRSQGQRTRSTPSGIFAEQCENILGRRGSIGGMYSQRPSRARLVADAFAHARNLLATRVDELAMGESIASVADAAKMLAGAALAALESGDRIQTPQQLGELVRASPSQIPWWDLPSSRSEVQRYIEDTHEWWARVDGALSELGDIEAPDSHTLHMLLRLIAEYAFWSATGSGDLPRVSGSRHARKTSDVS
jgi:hypothetical protein